MANKTRVALKIALAVVVVLILVGVWLVDGSDQSEDVPDHTVLTVPLPLPSGDEKVTVDRDNQLDGDEEREAAHSDPAALNAPAVKEPLDLHEDTRDETPAGITKEQVQAGRRATDKLAEKQLLPPVDPAGAQAYSCPARNVVNQSALSGRRVGVALHFTVSNPGSLDAIRGLFNRPSFGASSNYGFELFNLRCQRWVPNGRKAWAQGAANSAYISIEIITNDRSRVSWLGSPALKRGVLAGLVRDLARGVGAPLKRVDPAGCTWTPGIVDHDSLECGNTHWDVGRNFPWDVFMRQVRQGVATAAGPVLTRVERAVVSRRCYHRKQHLAGKRAPTNLKWARHYIRRIGKLRANLRKLGLTATRNRKLRHRVLGGYAVGKACR